MKQKLEMGVPYLIYVVHVKLHHAIGLLGFLRRRNEEHAPPFIVMCMMDRHPCCHTTRAESMLLPYGISPRSQ
jgi:hypothetical protein